ncbi:hypothetical protein GPECTOR_20g395 [Gonium pectorale]|uniref:Uncharacterized protein n=1 Tax=Gonium pectorale TaxID=33097 RepID=A0A150GI89_GONPE|nr:hypothetical protein GPECTOR_20g395 [Gonium pectorale]|eukprot:KXZ49541.1 hypothetical protein GPECTOR_20g395 [Gonium pectorale]
MATHDVGFKVKFIVSLASMLLALSGGDQAAYEAALEGLLDECVDTRDSRAASNSKELQRQRRKLERAAAAATVALDPGPAAAPPGGRVAGCRPSAEHLAAGSGHLLRSGASSCSGSGVPEAVRHGQQLHGPCSGEGSGPFEEQGPCCVAAGGAELLPGLGAGLRLHSGTCEDGSVVDVTSGAQSALGCWGSGRGSGAAAEATASVEAASSGVGLEEGEPTAWQGRAAAARASGHAGAVRSLAARRAAMRKAIDAWCRVTVQPSSQPSQQQQQKPASPCEQSCGAEAEAPGAAPACSAPAPAPFAALRPLLAAVLELGEPEPLSDVRRNGSRTELQVASLMSSALPPGWRLYCGAVITAVDGQPFRTARRLKGEADVLLVDHEGCVQALLEVKTAKGNPYVALYEDVDKLLALLRAVRGRTVTFRHTASPQPVTLEFGARLRPIYVLGCGHDPAGVGAEGAGAQPSAAADPAAPQTHGSTPAHHGPPKQYRQHRGERLRLPAGAGAGAVARVGGGTRKTTPALAPSVASASAAAHAAAAAPPALRSAVPKLLAMELGRQLASEGPDAWAGVQLAGLSAREVRLALPGAAAAPLARRVAAYFARLARCDVFTVHSSA